MLDRIDARIDAGECVALMGPSGSGKSTLMNIIGCLDRPTSGDYLFCGREVGRLDDDELSRIRKSRIGFVIPELQSFSPRLTAAETSSCRSSMPVYRDASVMTEPWSCSGASGSWIARDIGLPSCREARSSVAVDAGTLPVNDPSLILADEPTGNLDSRSGAQILDLLLTLHREGRTILIVTHDETVATRAGRVIHLRDGRIWRGGSSLADRDPPFRSIKLLPYLASSFLSVNLR